MSINYLAVVSCDSCGEMIITKLDGSIFCGCTTKRLCEHPEGMGNCHDCFIDNLEAENVRLQTHVDIRDARVAVLQGRIDSLRGAMVKAVKDLQAIARGEKIK